MEHRELVPNILYPVKTLLSEMFFLMAIQPAFGVTARPLSHTNGV
jgi:hypothetical protein